MIVFYGIESFIVAAGIQSENLRIIRLFIFAVAAAVLTGILIRLYYGVLLKTLRTLRRKESELREIKDRLSELEYKTKNITDSLIYARHIQEALLPIESFLRDSFSDYFIFYQPRDIVSGDFYWFGNYGGKSIIAVADCTGHGVPGALLSMLGHNFLNQIIRDEKIIRPGQVLDRLDDLVRNIFSSEGQGTQFLRDGMDIGVCTVDREAGKLEFSGAFNSAYIIAGGKLNEIKGDRVFLGARPEGFSFTTKEVDIDDGMSVYLFSDGYADQFGGVENKKFMYRRFRYLLTSIHNLEMSKQKIILQDTIRTWMGNKPQIDDILVIGVRI